MRKLFRFLKFLASTGIAFGGAFVFACTAFAQGTFVSLTNGQGLNSGGGAPMLSNIFNSASSPSTLPQFFNAIFTTALSVGAILAVLRLAYAGWMYMGSADMWGSKETAKEAIRNAILGLLLLFGIYIILYQINPNILNLNILQNIGSSSNG